MVAQVPPVRSQHRVPVGRRGQDGKGVPVWLPGQGEHLAEVLWALGARRWLPCPRQAAATCAASRHLPCSHGSDLPAGAENSLPQSGLLTRWRCLPPLWLGSCWRWHRHRFPCCSLQRPSRSVTERRSGDWGQNCGTGAKVAAGSALCCGCAGIRLRLGSRWWFFISL